MKLFDSENLEQFGTKKEENVTSYDLFEEKAFSDCGSITYDMLRLKYLDESEATESLLCEFFKHEPDSISGEVGSDIRELLAVNVLEYSFNGESHCDKAWFTVSAKNRFICEGIIDDISTDNIRECKLIDFSDRLFMPKANPNDHRLAIGEFTFTFDHPLFYNLVLMLLLQSDDRYQKGYRVSQRAIVAPKIMLNYEILGKYDIEFDESRRENLHLVGASYCVLNDFNAEKQGGYATGNIELRVIDGSLWAKGNEAPISLNEILLHRKRFASGYMWLGIGPDLVMSDGTKIPGVQFRFLGKTDKVTVRGDESNLIIYVCRLSSGWGGIKFCVKDVVDYYRLAAWLVVAVSYACDAEIGIDWKTSLSEYWPTYKPLIAAGQIGSSKSSDSSNSDESFEDSLNGKINYWKSKLLDTGKRNKMINYRETKRSTLKILEPNAEELFNKLAVSEKTLTFQKPVTKESDIRTYMILSLFETLSYPLPVTKGDIKTDGTIVERERTLKNLKSKAKLAQEEQGTNILYLCFGFIYWKEHNREESPWIKSPLLMMPVTLGLKSLNAPYTLSKSDDEVEVNPTLAYLFESDYNIHLPEFELKNKSSFGEYIKEIESIVDSRGWRVIPEVSLGLVSFLKISMYHDLDNNHEMLMSNPILRAMAGDRDALEDIPQTAENYDFDQADPKEWHEVVDADSSQQEAILLSKMGVSFVMQGPPGTGKSQTITNIIAEALADGKKVLFVSEKAAALQVVLKRLTEVGLADFCLSLHDYKANKKEIIDSIGANLSLKRGYVRNSELDELTELFQDRLYLDKYASELHQPILPLGCSVYEAFGKYARLEFAADISFSIDHLMDISREQYAGLLFSVTEFEKALKSINGQLTENPWYNTRAISAGQVYKQELVASTSNLSDELREIESLARELDKYFNTIFSYNWIGICKGRDEIERVLRLPDFSKEWLDSVNRDSMRSVIASEEQIQERYNKECDLYRTVYSDDIIEAPVDTWLDEITYINNMLKELGVDSDEALNYSRIILNKSEADELLGEFKEFTNQYCSAYEILGGDSTVTFTNASKLYRLIDLLADNKNQHIEKGWFETGVIDNASKQLSESARHADILHDAVAKINNKWDETVYGINRQELLKFVEENKWIYNKEDDLHGTMEGEVFASESLLEEMKKLQSALQEAAVLLRYSCADSFESMSILSKVLSLIIEAPYMEAEWYDSRKNAEIMLLVNEAAEKASVIKEKTDKLLENWEPAALSIDAEGMMRRFKTEYLGVFRKWKSNYKEDIKTIRFVSKVIGKTPSDVQIGVLLQQVIEINEEKRWFETKEDQLTAHLKHHYKGIETDWDAVRKGMQFALQIAEAFPYGSIPEETIQAIGNITNSIQLTGSARRLSEELNLNNIEKCFEDIRNCNYVERVERTDSLMMNIIPIIENFLENGKKQCNYIDRIKSLRKSQDFTYTDMTELSYNLNIEAAERSWFDENNQLNQSLFGEEYAKDVSDWNRIQSGIHLAKSVMEIFNNESIPEITINYICSENDNRIMPSEVETLSPYNQMCIRERLMCVAPQINLKEMGVSEDVMLWLQKYSSVGDWLNKLSEKVTKYAVADNLPLEELLGKLVNVKQAVSIRGAVGDRAVRHRKLFGDRYNGLDTKWDLFLSDLNALEQFILSDRSVVTNRTLESLCASQEQRDKLSSLYCDLEAKASDAQPKIEVFQQQFYDSDFMKEKLQIVADHYDACLNGFVELNAWLDYVETRRQCDNQGLADFTAKIVAADNTIEDVKGAFEKEFYRQWIIEVMNTVPSVLNFRRRIQEQKIERFAAIDQKQHTFSRQRIYKSIVETYPQANAMTKAGSELGILRHEMEKKRRIMPLRKLFHSIPNLLLTLKPCLMMSPLSVAYFLEADLYKFDMVIFDEASQIFPQDAIGAILRAKQVIIAGDTKQLPPTSFFASTTGNEDNFYDDEDSDDEEVYDSILEETANILPNRTLMWHYRSRHEHLIAYSNQEIYRNELITFPSSNENERDTGVEFVYVEDGYYEGGGKNRNIIEAKKCVELVKEHFDKYPNRSLGIIAFSEKQQNAITTEIQRFREDNPKYETFFAEDKEDEFFVKNLENVQGDERDTIIFSVGYARTKEQKDNDKPMTMRFGPLGIQGGERRLNVAITRAKYNIKLVSSIFPSDIDLNRTSSEGVRMLRGYIEFAMNGEATLSSAHTNSRPDDFVDVVAEFLREHGYDVSQYIGCSGYKIDIAIRYPSDTVQLFAAGIECDGNSYSSARTVRDRDVLRKSVLTSMGWNMYRVWSAEWYKNPEVEAEKLLAFVNKAIDECDKKVKEKEYEKQKAEEERRQAEEKKKREEEERRRAEEAKKREEDARRKAEEVKKREEEVQRQQEAKRREQERKREEQLHRMEMEARKKAEEAKRREEEQKRGEYETKKRMLSYSWVKKGVALQHKSFGIGKVVSIYGGYIKVAFSAGTKQFAFPGALENGFLFKPIDNAGGIQSNGRTTSVDLIGELSEKGFECVDNRSSSNILWVLYAADKAVLFETIAAKYKVRYKLERRGSMATNNAPAWRIMIN